MPLKNFDAKSFDLKGPRVPITEWDSCAGVIPGLPRLRTLTATAATFMGNHPWLSTARHINLFYHLVISLMTNAGYNRHNGDTIAG